MNDRTILGYILLACKKLNYTKEEARKLIAEVSILLITKTDEELEDGFQWYKELEEKDIKTEMKQTEMGIKPRKPKRITKFPEGYRSKLSKENERIINLIRTLKDS
ncbi:hypothetical protein [Halalkalibacter akibai]|uniref:Uncharacterized protein n=1 Tax=Halalkalibacter akibai (strain ATCC 43226 / DSM 21942 / CIP 109018 / JCM 9157 / 1139) TaxID=1236973 RepID=W4QZT9_HALA3|nr:hypothetical protein [Halalkalibacter akibai]GAE37596.1 hypothetical protein JCM9157_4908 [Halalkalibacter akibai JCM 9157]